VVRSADGRWLAGSEIEVSADRPFTVYADGDPIADLPTGAQTRIQHALVYCDGFGRVIQHKTQAAPGPVTDAGPTVSPRWVGSGWTIYNNKGKPVRQYEPFFSATHRFEFARTVGVSPVLFYDPLDRVVATWHPNDTYTKVVFDPWGQASWDANDTATLDPRADADVRALMTGYLATLSDGHTWYTRRSDGGLGPDEQDAAHLPRRRPGTGERHGSRQHEHRCEPTSQRVDDRELGTVVRVGEQHEVGQLEGRSRDEVGPDSGVQLPEEHRCRCADNGADEQDHGSEGLRVARSCKQQVPDRVYDGRNEREDESLGRQVYARIVACSTGR